MSNKASPNFDLSDSLELYGQHHLQATTTSQKMDRSFDIMFESSSKSERYFDRSFEASQGFSSREVTVMEGKQQQARLDTSSDGIHLTTSRTGRILDRSPDRRSRDPSLDKSGLNRSFGAEGHSVRTGRSLERHADRTSSGRSLERHADRTSSGRSLERHSDRTSSEAVGVAPGSIDRTSDFLSVQPERLRFDDRSLVRSVCLSVSACLCVCSPVCSLPVLCLSAYLSIYPVHCICLFVFLSMGLAASVFVCRSVNVAGCPTPLFLSRHVT